MSPTPRLLFKYPNIPKIEATQTKLKTAQKRFRPNSKLRALNMELLNIVMDGIQRLQDGLLLCNINNSEILESMEF